MKQVFDPHFMEDFISDIKHELMDELEVEISQKRVFNQKQAAEYLNMTPPTFRNLVMDGLIKQTYFPQKVKPVYLKEDLDDFINKSKEGVI